MYEHMGLVVWDKQHFESHLLLQVSSNFILQEGCTLLFIVLSTLCDCIQQSSSDEQYYFSAQEGAVCLLFKGDVKPQQESLFSSAVELVDTIERIKISLEL